MQGGGVFFWELPAKGKGGPSRFLALFQEVHFWSIKVVHFFHNANILNFELFFRLLLYVVYYIAI